MPRRVEIDPTQNYSAEEQRRLNRNEYQRRWRAGLSEERRAAMRQAARDRRRVRQRLNQPNDWTSSGIEGELQGGIDGEDGGRGGEMGPQLATEGGGQEGIAVVIEADSGVDAGDRMRVTGVAEHSRRVEIDPTQNYSAEEQRRLNRNEYQRRWRAGLSEERRATMRQDAREYQRWLRQHLDQPRDWISSRIEGELQGGIDGEDGGRGGEMGPQLGAEGGGQEGTAVAIEADSGVDAGDRMRVTVAAEHWCRQVSRMENCVSSRNRQLQWNKVCGFCHTVLLECETELFCCKNGERILPRLPELPVALQRLFGESGLSRNSRKLNRLFCFTALCVQGEFVRLETPSSVAMMGRTYHQVMPVTRPHQPLHWYIYDESERITTANAQLLPVQWVMQVGGVLQDINPYCRLIRQMRDMRVETALLKLNGAVVEDEVAAIIHGNNSVTLNPRVSVFWLHNEEREVYMSILDRQYEPLQYPLLFPHGTAGWFPFNEHRFSQIEWYRSRLLHESRFLLLGRLTCEYLVDMYSRYEEEKLNFLATNGYRRSNTGISDDFADDDGSGQSCAMLPSSFLGSRLWCSGQMADALALARAKGRPTLFITMTTNPQWSEIEAMLGPGQTAAEIPTVVVRVFHAHLQHLKKLLRSYFGPLAYMMNVVEFQKRGLPHVHMIVRTECEIPMRMIDSIISAEMPHDEELAFLVRKYMIHRHSARCQVNGRCTWKYPRPLSQATYVDSRGYVQYRRRSEEDVYVVSYSPFLLKELNCHINVDIAATVQVFMYLYTYIYKGYDKVQYRIEGQSENRPEMEDYVAARYISSTEAAWRLFSYHVSEKSPGVKCLPVHLQDRGRVRYRRENTASLLERYFLRPCVAEFSKLTYIDYYEQYLFLPMHRATHVAGEYLEVEQQGVIRCVVRKRTKRELVCRMRLVMPRQGELFYLRQLLLHTTPRSWEELKMYNGHTYETYQETVTAMGLLQNTTEPMLTMQEAVSSLRTPAQLRFLFALLILDGAPAMDLWNQFRGELIADLAIDSTENVATQQALMCVENVLLQHGTTVAAFGLPVITIRCDLVVEELRRYREHGKYLQEAHEMRSKMNSDQAYLYDHIAAMTEYSGIRAPIFIYGKGGTGKTFLLNAICLLIRGRQRIVLTCATTALASRLYPGGKTAHSLFQIPVNEDNVAIHSMIDVGSNKAALLKEAEVIIWDEFAMANKAVIESVDILLREICNNDYPFGGKCFIAAGDFRQIAPIVQGCGRQATISASIKSSSTWRAFTVHKLDKPIRYAGDRELIECVTSIGENWESDVVTLTLFRTTNSVDEAKDFLFPASVLALPAMCEKRAFLSPLNVYVDEFNRSILDRLAGAAKKYFSYDSIRENDQVIHTAGAAESDFLHNYEHPTLPRHVLELKEGAICHIMRLLDAEKGLVRNARVVIHSMHERYVTVRLVGLDGGLDEHIHPISRADFYHQPKNSSFTIYRRQLPLRLAYSTTFHSCLGLTLDKIVLDLRTDVFAHGQLYTALTRIRRREDVLILHNNPTSSVTTKNVVYRELLHGEGSRKLCPVCKLTPYIANWTIKVRVTSKSIVRTFDSRRGRGKVFNVDLSDGDGDEIQATMFDMAVEKFYGILEVGGVYYISKGTVRRANKKFSTLNHDYQIILDVESTVEGSTDDNVRTEFGVRSNFVRINELQPYVKNGLLLDVIGIVCDMSGATNIKRKRNNDDVPKRELTLLDESEQTVKVSLWGSLATKDAEVLMQTIRDNPIVTITKLRASSFEGISLSTTSKSIMNINPDVEAARNLRLWYQSREKQHKYTSTGLLSNHVLLAEINPSTIQDGESAYFNVKATVTFIDPKQAMWYDGCVSCKKKPIDRNSKLWCEKCQRDTETCKRYVFRAMIADSTGEVNVTIFNEQGEELLGYAAEELFAIRNKEQGEQVYLNVLEKATWVTKIFRICVTQSEYNGYKTVKMVVREIASVDWPSESTSLCERLRKISEDGSR